MSKPGNTEGPAPVVYRHAMGAGRRCTGAILLGAGFSRRFGSVKLQALLPNGNTILHQCFNNILQATDNIIVVGRKELLETGAYQFLPDRRGIKLVLCEDAASGMGHSLASAIPCIPDTWTSALICLGDMPFLQKETLQAIINNSTENNIVIPLWQSQRGHPVSFGRRYFVELTHSAGDSGGRHVIKQHSDSIQELQTDDPGIIQDIDTPEALAMYTKTP